MAFVSVTRLRLRSWLYLPLFLRHAIPSSQQSMAAPGNLKTFTRQQRFSVFWTLTVWQDETSMRNYMRSGAHREAMPKLAEWCDEASTVHWHQEGIEPPSWEEATRRMLAEGRLAPVQHPSANHAAGIILDC
ncbi:MAG: DUF3291 domain-containing protein [Oscillatoriales cyanobacterium C42_A2020_001]|nr:DUF3291 domain-containing protein [Leptolyngbyaceae cyanobacterium C42_A2020_001]